MNMMNTTIPNNNHKYHLYSYYNIHFALMLRQRRLNLEKQKNTLETLIKQENIILNNFAVLIGMSPNNINDIKRGKLETFEYKMQIPNEIKSDVLALTSINDKIALLPDEQRQQIEIMLDELLVINKANKVNSVIEM